jgi:hypothetical protein
MPEQRTLKNRTIIAVWHTGPNAGVAPSALPGMGSFPSRGPDVAHAGTGEGRVAVR